MPEVELKLHPFTLTLTVIGGAKKSVSGMAPDIRTMTGYEQAVKLCNGLVGLEMFRLKREEVPGASPRG